MNSVYEILGWSKYCFVVRMSCIPSHNHVFYMHDAKLDFARCMLNKMYADPKFEFFHEFHHENFKPNWQGIWCKHHLACYYIHTLVFQIWGHFWTMLGELMVHKYVANFSFCMIFLKISNQLVEAGHFANIIWHVTVRAPLCQISGRPFEQC